ncbi:M23 family metallopeptidase [Arthrobacter sp. NPDC090010]|uniref:M23 family metallopeptidase n=1 Tax=Arthrobacter sp. NPDC090010 TaxID=3363942 RepID=UPI0038190814
MKRELLPRIRRLPALLLPLLLVQSAPFPSQAAPEEPGLRARAADRSGSADRAGPSLEAGPSVKAGAWGWPLEHRPGRLLDAVVRPFDPPAKPWLSGHRGVDLATPDGIGATILSPADGVVSFRGTVVDRPVVTVDHGHGIKSSFEPVRSDLEPGTRIRQGQRIGSLAGAHCAALSCVHWGVRVDGTYVDPLRFLLDDRPSVLLPWEGPG